MIDQTLENVEINVEIVFAGISTLVALRMIVS